MDAKEQSLMFRGRNHHPYLKLNAKVLNLTAERKMKTIEQNIKHYFREVLGSLSENEIISNEKLIKKITSVEKLMMRIA